VIITSNYQSVVNLGAGVPVDVFTEPEALTFLAARTGQADAASAVTTYLHRLAGPRRWVGEHVYGAVWRWDKRCVTR